MTDATRDNNSSQLRAGPCTTKWLVYYGLETPALVGLYLKVEKVMGYLAPARQTEESVMPSSFHRGHTDVNQITVHWCHTHETKRSCSRIWNFNKEEISNCLTNFGLDILVGIFVYANNLMKILSVIFIASFFTYTF